MPAAPFRRPLLYFRLYLSFSEFRHGFVGKGVPPAVGDYDVVQQGQFSEKCLECLDRALERNGVCERRIYTPMTYSTGTEVSCTAQGSCSRECE